ncbi:hypothetical protein OUZ56_032824 [Daphnia magna]|uniref:Uncharacterized protein n=1 Tax=Daphnia magna TaxID=35525 RepID=A0ABR0B9N0_9CRUS|nr:hypothetical protein OUZ56_032824 [Daphnia magna]
MSAVPEPLPAHIRLHHNGSPWVVRNSSALRSAMFEEQILGFQNFVVVPGSGVIREIPNETAIVRTKTKKALHILDAGWDGKVLDCEDFGRVGRQALATDHVS